MFIHHIQLRKAYSSTYLQVYTEYSITEAVISRYFVVLKEYIICDACFDCYISLRRKVNLPSLAKVFYLAVYHRNIISIIEVLTASFGILKTFHGVSDETALMK